MMGAILSQTSPESKHEAEEEDSTLIEIHELSEEDSSRGTADIPKMKDCPNCPTDPHVRQFLKTFRELQSQKEQFTLQLHNEVLQWRLMVQRGIANRFQNNKKVNLLIREFVKVHEQLDEFLEEERLNLDKILPKQTSVTKNASNKSRGKEQHKDAAKKKAESLELTPEIMQRFVCFQRCNDQHIQLLTQVLTDIEHCKNFATTLESPASSKRDSTRDQDTSEERTSSRPIAITVSSDS